MSHPWPGKRRIGLRRQRSATDKLSPCQETWSRRETRRCSKTRFCHLVSRSTLFRRNIRRRGTSFSVNEQQSVYGHFYALAKRLLYRRSSFKPFFRLRHRNAPFHYFWSFWCPHTFDFRYLLSPKGTSYCRWKSQFTMSCFLFVSRVPNTMELNADFIPHR